MKIAIVGSTAYREARMLPLKEKLEGQGHEVRMPTFDGGAANELQLMANNRAMIEWADVVYVLWDGRSMGTWGDICMAFALRKPIVKAYLQSMTCERFFQQYAAFGPDVRPDGEGQPCA